MKDLHDDLIALPAPDHRAGFWSDLSDDLALPQRPAERRKVRTPNIRSRRRLALVAALATIAAFSFLPGMLTGENGDSQTGGDLTPPASSTTTSPPTTVVDTTTPGEASAPWDTAPMTANAVADLYAVLWRKAENKAWCSVLAPDEPTPPAAERAADFGGGWGVAYDRTDGPGRNPDGSYCANCGRSAYGIAGVGIGADETQIRSKGEVQEFADGSIVAYYPEGFDPASELMLADIALPSEGCVYQAWSMLGRDHLKGFVSRLRRVEGLQADPVVRRTAADTILIDGGTPPWDAPSISDPDLLAVAFARSLDAEATEVIGFADPGPGLESATVRAAAIGNWGVAWDNPSGLGHDSGNYPCANCGRGVIGIGSIGPYDPQGPGLWADPALAKITWNEGSLAVITWRIGDLQLPTDQVAYPDAVTGEMVPDGIQATVYIPGAGTYQVWSHLGYDHLLSLIDAMRFVQR